MNVIDWVGANDLLAALATLLASGATLGAMLASHLSLRKAKAGLIQTLEVPLDEKLRQLARVSNDATRLAAEVDLEVRARVAQAEKAAADATEAERISTLSAEQTEAVASLLRGQVAAELSSAGKADRRRARWTNFLYFTAGILASVAVTLFVRPVGG